MFQVLFTSSQILGNYIGSVLVVKTTGPVFFLIMSAIMVVAVIGWCFLQIPKTEKNEDEHED